MSTATDPVTEDPVITDTTDLPTEGDTATTANPADPAPIADPAATTEALAEAQRAAMTAERQRALDITALCARHHASDQASDFIARGLTLDQVRIDLLRQYEAANGPELHPGITRSQDTGSWQAVINKINQQGTHP